MAETTHETTPERWEIWTLVSISLVILMLLTYAIAFMRLGTASVYAYAIGIKMFGVATVPLMLLGLLRTIFRPPAIRRSRTIAFIALTITGLLGHRPLFSAPLSTEDWRSTHTYRLPFDGEWVTLAGGDDMDRNYHATMPTLRFAYDFSMTKDGKLFQLDGAKPEDYFVYGQPVVAPVQGRVLAIESGLSDAAPGKAEGGFFGNHIVIEVGPSEYLYIAHLKKDSINVHVGDTVTPGQTIAAVGNSGYTVAPHLHVHLQTTTNFPNGESLPLRFSNYQNNGKQVTTGMPLGSLDTTVPDGEHVSQMPNH